MIMYELSARMTLSEKSHYFIYAIASYTFITIYLISWTQLTNESIFTGTVQKNLFLSFWTLKMSNQMSQPKHHLVLDNSPGGGSTKMRSGDVIQSLLRRIGIAQKPPVWLKINNAIHRKKRSQCKAITLDDRAKTADYHCPCKHGVARMNKHWGI
jgi:hypothetical protein